MSYVDLEIYDFEPSQVTSSHVKSRLPCRPYPRQLDQCVYQTARSLAQQPGEQGSSARRARGVFPLDMIPLILPVPGRKLDQHQAPILLVLRDRIQSSDGPP